MSIHRIKKVSLCLGRHTMPLVEDSIFPTKVDPLNVHELEETAFMRIHELVKIGHVDEIQLYVTGLSVALLAVINAWHTYKKLAPHLKTQLVAYHYNRDDDTYYAQQII